MRSKTDLARYLEEEGITDLTAEDFDFTVRGKHSVGQPSKRKVTEPEQSGTQRQKKRATSVSQGVTNLPKSSLKGGISRRKLSQHKDKSTKRKNLEKNDSPKKGKTISQRLVIKMAFSSGDSQPKTKIKDFKKRKSLKTKVRSESSSGEDVGIVSLRDSVNLVGNRVTVSSGRSEECCMSPKKNPRFREALEEDAEVKTHGANVFDLFDPDGHLLDQQSQMNVVNGTNTEKLCKGSDFNQNSSGGLEDPMSPTRLKRRGSGNVDYALLSGKNRRISSERRSSWKRQDSETSSVNHTQIKSATLTDAVYCDIKTDESESLAVNATSADSLTQRTLENVSEQDNSSTVECTGQKLSLSQSPVSSETFSNPSVTPTNCGNVTESVSETGPPSPSPGEEEVEADDNSLDIGIETWALIFIVCTVCKRTQSAV